MSQVEALPRRNQLDAHLVTRHIQGMKKKPSADVESLAEMLIVAHKRFLAACRTGSGAEGEAEAADKKVGDFIARIKALQGA
jgi:hypothetical protein